MKKAFGLALVMSLALFTAACGTNESANTSTNTATDTATVAKEYTFKHQLGETTVKQNPEKVVVFDFGALDSLDKLGVNVAGVAQSSLPSYLDKYKDEKYENIGSLKEPDFEKIAEMEPDLILISGRQMEAYEELQKIAPTLYVGVDTANYMDSFKENMTRLGQIFSKEAEVEKELKAIDEKIETIKEKAAKTNKNGLIILANEGAVSAYGPNSRFGLIHDVMNIPAVDKDIKVDGSHGQSISFEYVAEKNPDYLFVIDRGSVVEGETKTTAQQLVENELVKKTKAFTENHIVYLDPNYWYLSGGGLESVGKMIDEVFQAYN